MKKERNVKLRKVKNKTTKKKSYTDGTPITELSTGFRIAFWIFFVMGLLTIGACVYLFFEFIIFISLLHTGQLV